MPELPPPAEADQDLGMDVNMFDDSDHPGHPLGLGGPFMGEVPGSADVVFDLIRVRFSAWIEYPAEGRGLVCKGEGRGGCAWP